MVSNQADFRFIPTVIPTQVRIHNNKKAQYPNRALPFLALVPSTFYFLPSIFFLPASNSTVND